MPLQTRVTLEMVHFDGRAVGGAPKGCARCLRCHCEHLLSASRKRPEVARVYAVAAKISTFASTPLKKLLATTLCGAVMADGEAKIPSIRPNGAQSGLSDQLLAQAVQSSSARG